MRALYFPPHPEQWFRTCSLGVQTQGQLSACLLSQAGGQNGLSVDAFGTWRMKPGTNHWEAHTSFLEMSRNEAETTLAGPV